MPEVKLEKVASRTYELGGANFRVDSNNKLFDFKEVTISDLQHLLRETASNEILGQDKVNNKPSRVISDGQDKKPITLAEKQVVAFFNTSTLSLAMMKLVTSTLMTNIKESLARRQGRKSQSTGNLARASNWQWFYRKYKENGAYEKPRKVGMQNIELGINDMLYLVPTENIFYATVVAQRLRHSAPIEGGKYKSGKKKGQDRANRYESFIHQTTKALKSSPALKGFAIGSGFTTRNSLSNEVRGTGKSSKVGSAITQVIYIKASIGNRSR